MAPPTNRPFRAEATKRNVRPSAIPAPGDAGAQSFMMGIAEALDALRAELRGDIAALLDQKIGVSGLPSAKPREGMTAEQELHLLRQEIASLSTTIERTKKELASLYQTSKDNKRIDVMRDELGAIVKDTESATSTILENMEAVDEVAQLIKTKAGTAEIKEAADAILDRVVKVFETCNFQDLTGQRINKVVNTMKLIEEKVTNLVGIWGTDALAAYKPTQEVKGQDQLDKTLATTTKSDSRVTQADVDKMFS